MERIELNIGCVLGMVGMIVAAVTHKQLAGFKASAVLAAGAGFAWVVGLEEQNGRIHAERCRALLRVKGFGPAKIPC